MCVKARPSEPRLNRFHDWLSTPKFAKSSLALVSSCEFSNSYLAARPTGDRASAPGTDTEEDPVQVGRSLSTQSHSGCRSAVCSSGEGRLKRKESRVDWRGWVTSRVVILQEEENGEIVDETKTANFWQRSRGISSERERDGVPLPRPHQEEQEEETWVKKQSFLLCSSQVVFLSAVLLLRPDKLMEKISSLGDF